MTREDEGALGDRLVAAGQIKPHQLLACKAIQHARGNAGRPVSLYDVLVEQGFLAPTGANGGALHGSSESAGPSVMGASVAFTHPRPTTGRYPAPGAGPAVAVPPPLAGPPGASGSGAGGSRPETIGRYRIIEEVGKGGMGVVYRAHDPKLDRDVAIKLVRDEVIDDELRERFRREARVVAKMRHGNIANIHECGETPDGRPYLVMDFIAGGALPAIFEAKRPSYRRIAEIVASVARALAHAHDQGIGHRDVKPANVMIGDGGVVYLTDFGLASDVAANTQLTSHGRVLGTPAYLAPEQADGEPEDIGPHSDVYGAGGLLYWCLTGRAPFEAPRIAGLIKQILFDRPTWPTELRSDVPEALEKITMRCLEKEPARRYRTAEALATALERFAEGPRKSGKLARSGIGGAARGRGPNPFVIVASIAIVIGLPVGGWLLLRGSGDPVEPVAPATERPTEVAGSTPTIEGGGEAASEAGEAGEGADGGATIDEPTATGSESTASGAAGGGATGDEGGGPSSGSPEAGSYRPWSSGTPDGISPPTEASGGGALPDGDFILIVRTSFGAARLTFPGSIEATFELSESGRVDEALAALATIIEDGPGFAGPRILRALIRRRVGDLDGAAADLTDAIERGGADEAGLGRGTRMLLADVHFERHDTGAALASLSELAELLTGRPRLSVLLARIDILRRRGDLLEANAAVDEVLRVAPDHPGALCARVEIALERRDLVAAERDLERLTPATVHPTHRLFLGGRMAALNGQPDRALEMFEDALRMDPGFVPVALEMGIVLARMGRTDDANGILEKVVNADAHGEWGLAATVWMARVWTNRGRIERALTLVERALSIHPQDAFALHTKAFALAKARREEEALAALAEARKHLVPTPAARAQLLVDAALVAHWSERHEDARRDAAAAIEADPTLALGYFVRAISRHKLGDEDGCVVDLSASIRCNPLYASARRRRADHRRDRGDWAGAEEDYSAYLRVWPDTRGILGDRAAVRVELGRFEDAIADYRHILRFTTKENRRGELEAKIAELEARKSGGRKSGG